MTKVLIAGFKHETNTFSVLKTDRAAYEARSWVEGAAIPEAYRGTNTEIAAFIDAAGRHGWTPVYAVAGDATPSGPVTQAMFDTAVGAIARAVDEAGGVDAMLLNLHGAMVCEHTDDGEGALLEALRERYGRALPIGVTLDLHANVTDRMAALCDIMVSYRTYPHVDLHDIATECADLLARMLKGGIRPTVTVARRETMEGFDQGRTTAPGPMLDALERARAMMAEPGVLSVSVNAGFTHADTYDTGPSVVVVGDGADARYRAMAEELMAFGWETRHIATVGTVSYADAMAVARAEGRPGAPVVIADFADNPGGGGYSDSTGLLRAMVEAGLRDAAFGMICDPEATAACHEAGEGARIPLALGGKTDPRFGAPVEMTGTVKALSDGRFRFEGPMQAGLAIDCGPSALFEAGGLSIAIGSRRYQNYDRAFFTHLGLVPEERAVVAVKSAQHFRAAYGAKASAIVLADEGHGLTSHDLKRLPYARVRRPVYPLDLE